ncbi:MAG: amino acid ABC transporter ATP-binding protein [Bacteroides sp.]|nr:amino acid ABC transporter ATP-binding protein [Bacteroides sp.]
MCIIGSMGSGKSTLLRCIAGLEHPEEGSICIDGCPLTQKNAGGYNYIGMVFQDFNLFPHFNVLHNLTLAPIKVLGVSEKEAEEQAYQQLQKVGLGEKAFLFPNELSAGQKQRVAIARCLMMKPRLMLFDEPTSALDPIATAEVMDVMRKLKKEITQVIITHKISLVNEIADSIIFMQNGKVCEKGSPADLLYAPKQAATRSFLSYQKNMIYRIENAQFDRPELNARIECYCNRFGLGSQAFHFVQLVVEEILNLLPLDNGLDLVLSKSDTEVRMSLNITLSFEEKMYLDPLQAKDDLSLSLIEGLCDVIQETTNEDGRKLIHLELNKERLL